MGLRTDDITTQLVETALGESVSTVSGLCRSNNINKWSYYKPVSGTWPYDSIASTWYGIAVLNGWTYSPPAVDDRLGDFRGYEDNAIPPYTVDNDTHAINAPDIYPYGVGLDHFEVYFYVYTTALSGCLSVSDLNIHTYYLCFKAVVGDTTYYKTYNTLGSYPGYAQITIAPSLVTPLTTPYSFTNYPYYVGSTTLYFGFANKSLGGWTSTAALPADFGFYPVPDSSEQSSPAITDHYSFTIHDWAFVDVTGMAFDGSNYTYQSSHIDTSLTTWVLMSKPSWINVDVYKSGSYITNSRLWSTGMDINIIPNSDNTGSTRSGIVSIGDGSTVLATIGVSQYQVQYPPTVIVSTGEGYPDGFSTSSSSGYVAQGSTALSYNLTPTDVGLNVLCDVVLLKNTTQIDTDTIILRDNFQYNGSFTLADAADYNDNYVVQISKPTSSSGTSSSITVGLSSTSHDWPANYYGSGNTVTVNVTLSSDDTIYVADIPSWLTVSINQSTNQITMYPNSANTGAKRIAILTVTAGPNSNAVSFTASQDAPATSSTASPI